MQLKAFGGNGYVYLQEVFLPGLRERGIAEETIRQMTVHNPRRLLSLA
jgi:phosphotriesterase-related protein